MRVVARAAALYCAAWLFNEPAPCAAQALASDSGQSRRVQEAVEPEARAQLAKWLGNVDLVAPMDYSVVQAELRAAPGVEVYCVTINNFSHWHSCVVGVAEQKIYRLGGFQAPLLVEFLDALLPALSRRPPPPVMARLAITLLSPAWCGTHQELFQVTDATPGARLSEEVVRILGLPGDTTIDEGARLLIRQTVDDPGTVGGPPGAVLLYTFLFDSAGRLLSWSSRHAGP